MSLLLAGVQERSTECSPPCSCSDFHCDFCNFFGSLSFFPLDRHVDGLNVPSWFSCVLDEKAFLLNVG